MLKDLGAQYVLIGHSERRTIFGESDALINKKVRKVREWLPKNMTILAVH